MDEKKRFDDWNMAKKKAHKLGRVPAFKEGEIWWCVIGENIGIEINGKQKKFSRPVLVLKKISQLSTDYIVLTNFGDQNAIIKTL